MCLIGDNKVQFLYVSVWNIINELLYSDYILFYEWTFIEFWFRRFYCNRINKFISAHTHTIHSDSELLLCIEITLFFSYPYQVIAIVLWSVKNRRLCYIFKLNLLIFRIFCSSAIHYYLALVESLFVSLTSICDKAVSRIARERIEDRM